jgi:hypothetical protein
MVDDKNSKLIEIKDQTLRSKKNICIKDRIETRLMHSRKEKRFFFFFVCDAKINKQ